MFQDIADDGVLNAENQMWEMNYKRDKLELRHRIIEMRMDMLNQLNTQATLVAGAVVGGMISGGELETMDDPDHGLPFGFRAGLITSYIIASTLAMCRYHHKICKLCATIILTSVLVWQLSVGCLHCMQPHRALFTCEDGTVFVRPGTSHLGAYMTQKCSEIQPVLPVQHVSSRAYACVCRNVYSSRWILPFALV